MTETLGNKIRLLLLKAGLGAADFSKKLGISPQAVSDLLNDRNSPTLGKLEKVATALGVPLFYLLMNTEERARWDAPSGMEMLETQRDLIASLKKQILALEKEAAYERAKAVSSKRGA